MNAYLIQLRFENREKVESIWFGRIAANGNEAVTSLLKNYREDIKVFVENVILYTLRPATIRKHRPKIVEFKAKAIIVKGMLLYLKEDGETYVQRCKVIPQESNKFYCMIYSDSHDVIFD